MKLFRHISLGIALLTGASAFVAAQAPLGNEPPRQDQQDRRERMRESGGGFHRHPGPHAGDWLRRYANMPPADQEKALASDQEFQQLPVERQQKLRQRLQQFNTLPPERKQRILANMDWFAHLPPEQQDKLREYGHQFRALPDDRKQKMKVALKSLRQMSPEERQRMLDSPRFNKEFSSQEVEILRGMSQFSPPNEPDEGEQQPPQGPREP